MVIAAGYRTPSVPQYPRRTSQTSAIVLNASINSTALQPGEELGITVSLYNTLPAPNYVPVEWNWTINGFPVATWPTCMTPQPIEFIIVNGSVSAPEVQALGNASSGPDPFEFCPEGTHLNQLSFEASSSIAELNGTQVIDVSYPNQLSGPYQLASNFTVNGYWDIPLNGTEYFNLLTPVSSNPSNGASFQYPEVGPTAAHGFVPGTYTLLVSDEWGSTIVIPFSVT